MKYKCRVDFYQVPVIATVVEVEAENKDDACDAAFEAARAKLGTVCIGGFDDSGGDIEYLSDKEYERYTSSPKDYE